MLGQSNHSKLQKSKKANEKSILYLSLIRRFKVARDPQYASGIGHHSLN